MKTLGQKLKEIRLAHELTMDQLVNLLNTNYGLTINKSMISRWENDKSEPYTTYLSAYAKQFGIDLNYLLGLTTKEEQSKMQSLEENFPEGVSLLYRAEKELTKSEQEKMIKMINSVFFDE